MMPLRRPDSHKGENGRVLIIGGSLEYYGAPILSGLGSLYSGADLTYLLVPECNFEVSRSYYPDFIVRKYAGFHLNQRAIDEAVHLAEKVDTVLIGPGLGKDEDYPDTIVKIMHKIQKPFVLDADAISVAAIHEHPSVTITPHHGEMAQLLDQPLDELPPEEIENLVREYAKLKKLTILLKGREDIIIDEHGEGAVNITGHPGMTVGGSGDVLAGVVVSFIAQGMKPFESCCAAAFVTGTAGENLARQKGVCFSATDLALELPYVIK